MRRGRACGAFVSAGLMACGPALQRPPNDSAASYTPARAARGSPQVSPALPSLPSDRAPAETPARQPDVEPRCPPEMALITGEWGAYCIDRWEATLVLVDANGVDAPWPGNRAPRGREGQIRAVSAPGRKPQGYIHQRQATRACERAGKRLCEPEEWVRACKGPGGTRYPYGDARRAGVCNDRFKVLDHHPVVTLFKREALPGTDSAAMWDPRWMNDPRLHELPHTVVPTGSMAECTNAYGVYDMVGNLHEWVADPEGTFLGGFFMDTFQNGEGCDYRTTFHSVEHHDYSTGFRCCAEASFAGENARRP